MAIRKREVPTVKTFGTIFQEYKESYAILGVDTYVYWASGHLKKQLDSYDVRLGQLLRIVVAPYDRSLCVAFPENLAIDESDLPDTVTITEKVCD